MRYGKGPLKAGPPDGVTCGSLPGVLSQRQHTRGDEQVEERQLPAQSHLRVSFIRVEPTRLS